MLAFLLALLLGATSPGRARDLARDAVQRTNTESSEGLSLTRASALPSVRMPSDRQQLNLCDCGPASGDPNGLSCDGEGYLVSGFERHGQWVVGGDPVPLSRAICCRPCSSSDSDERDNIVVTLGCHSSSDPGSSFRCEQTQGATGSEEPASFVVGFTSASRVFAPGEPAFYPSDAAECCSPSLMHANGELTGLEPCDCIESASGVSCGDNRALVGFDEERIAPNGRYVPVGAAKCCRVCIGKKATMDCAALDHCSGRGACILGACACVSGWSGSSCTVREAGAGDIPAWAIAVIVVGSCLLGVLVIGSLAYICELVIEAREARNNVEEEEEEDAPTRPLLIQLDRDDDGSVGSEDSTDEDEEESDVDVAGRIAAAERDLNSEEEDDAEEKDGEEHEDGGNGSKQCGVRAQDENHQESEEEDIERIKERLKRGHGPLAGVICGVCLDRPVQVCVIPCGHVCMCRRCSRRVHRCPVCRSVVARRQKLFI